MKDFKMITGIVCLWLSVIICMINLVIGLITLLGDFLGITIVGLILLMIGLILTWNKEGGEE